jgi:hypothetical protein
MPVSVGGRVYAVNGPVAQAPARFLGGSLGVASVCALVLSVGFGTCLRALLGSVRFQQARKFVVGLCNAPGLGIGKTAYDITRQISLNDFCGCLVLRFGPLNAQCVQHRSAIVSWQSALLDEVVEAHALDYSGLRLAPSRGVLLMPSYTYLLRLNRQGTPTAPREPRLSRPFAFHSC